MFVVNEGLIEERILKLNKEIFENQVPIEHIHVEADKPENAWIPGAIGWCYEDEDENGEFIVIGTTTHFETEKEFRDTVCHEIIHALQIYNGLPVGHDTVLWVYYEGVCVAKGYDV